MPRKQTPSRGRGKAIIRVFCEGESEQAYTQFLKQHFADVAVLQYPKEVGANVFERAENRFKSDARYRDFVDTIDEVWFFFDVEANDSDKWSKRLRIIHALKKKKMRVRLLMTTGCIEYWLLLHYEKTAPAIQTPEQKRAIAYRLKLHEPSYHKGDLSSTSKIAENYAVAEENARATLHTLLADGLPTLEDTDQRNTWLMQNSVTFSTVYEAITFLKTLKADKGSAST